MTLAEHVRKGDWGALEDEWTELMLGDASIAPVLEALPYAARRREIPRILPHVREHADVLAGSGRAQEAAEMLGEAMLQGGSPGELGKPLVDAASKAWADEPWWPVAAETADFRPGVADLRASWRALRRLMAIEEGRAVWHGKGWGVGRIERVDLGTRDAEVRFASGRRDSFPLTTVAEIFDVLDDDDPRALLVNDPGELARRIREEPLEIVAGVLRRGEGSASQPQLKVALAQIGVEGGAFTTFWRRVRKEAETNEWFEVTGSGGKAQIRMLERAVDPAEGLRRQLARSRTLGDALTRVRDLLSGGGLEPGVRDAALETLEQLASTEPAPLSERMSAWMLVRDERGAAPEALAERIRRAAAEDDGTAPVPPLWELLNALPGLREQERAVELLREVHGEAWLDRAAEGLAHAPPGMARALADALERAHRRPELHRAYGVLLARPSKNPAMLVALAERIERAPVEADLPSPVQRAQCLLQLAALVQSRATSDPVVARTRPRIVELLAGGSPPLLDRLLEETGADELRRLASIVDRGVGRRIERVFTRLVATRAPEVFRSEERPFWEGDVVWTTSRGLARRQEELRRLREVDIPANSEAIGHAASHGDLSENSEWEAAIEEQRRLSARALQLEAEVRSARVLQHAPLAPGVASPGTEVRYRDLASGEVRTVRILGPWDSDEEGVVSYRSPLGAGMLGLEAGERGRVELPSGAVEVEILEVRPTALEPSG